MGLLAAVSAAGVVAALELEVTDTKDTGSKCVSICLKRDRWKRDKLKSKDVC
ncbi:hypothetical protein PGT21_009733 [Puccinia graminis f. sp. tritici]|uniref:Uncharacterized protein n=1 Tax=Puccinia graminis f. sp. tritici TaxID=56615 RepID=A0A5B0QES1_PUCGR|nr:hypothetical protein PGT21_009733 [Puccinia graminis f. sp. tritici]